MSAEALSIGLRAAGGRNHVVDVAEQIGVQDSVSAVVNSARHVAESLHLAESVAVSGSAVRVTGGGRTGVMPARRVASGSMSQQVAVTQRISGHKVEQATPPSTTEAAKSPASKAAKDAAALESAAQAIDILTPLLVWAAAELREALPGILGIAVARLWLALTIRRRRP